MTETWLSPFLLSLPLPVYLSLPPPLSLYPFPYLRLASTSCVLVTGQDKLRAMLPPSPTGPFSPLSPQTQQQLLERLPGGPQPSSHAPQQQGTPLVFASTDSDPLRKRSSTTTGESLVRPLSLRRGMAFASTASSKNDLPLMSLVRWRLGRWLY